MNLLTTTLMRKKHPQPSNLSAHLYQLTAGTIEHPNPNNSTFFLRFAPFRFWLDFAINSLISLGIVKIMAVIFRKNSQGVQN